MPKKKPAAQTVAEPDMKWKAQDALNTIARAEEYRRDRNLMREVKKIAKTQVKAVCK